MVVVHIWIEGGTLPNDNQNVSVVDNSHRFREGFRKLFSKAFQEHDLRIIIENGGGYRSAAKLYKNQLQQNRQSLILIDLDGPKKNKKSRLEDLNLSDFEPSTFFMVQAMEAWILSQPEVIEQRFFKFKHGSNLISTDPNLLGKNPESIVHPSRVLSTLISKYFRETRNGQVKKMKYGKLKTAPDLIELLDFQALRTMFEDAEKLNNVLNNLITTNRTKSN